MVQLVVGLGNPGPSYTATRHNIGQRVIEEYFDKYSLSVQEKYKGIFSFLPHSKVILAFPKTFMNLSGEFVGKMANFYKIPPEEILVLHDELDLPFGEIALKKGGGLAGHNGLKSLQAHLNSTDFLRIRMGIGRPTFQSVSDWVLSEFAKEEKMYIPDLLSFTQKAVESILQEGIDKSANLYNRKSVIQ